MKLKMIIILLSILWIDLHISAQKKPNILWINCDDLGRELTCYGNPDVYTPNMDQLAKEGVLFKNAYSNASVCSASRSSQITGMYPSTINCLNHRTVDKQPLPDGILPVMEIFRREGYFCTNGWAHAMNQKGKEDYNFAGHDFFDGTDWNQRAQGQPFFAQIQIHEPHRTFVRDQENPVNPDNLTLPGCYPNHPLLRADWAMYLESVQTADKRVGYILKRLKEENLLDNTIIFLFGDHGRPHLRDKQWLYEGGLQIPLIIRYPHKAKAGTQREDLISLIDVTASSLAYAGIDIPKNMHGKDILGGKKRNYVYGFRQRCGDAVDNIRSISNGHYKLIWNRMPALPYMQLTSYKKLQYPAFTLYKIMDKNGELKAPYNQFMAKSRPEFELYDLSNDPNELNNISNNPNYQNILKKLRKKLQNTLISIENNTVQESPQATIKAKQGSHLFLLKGLKKKGLPEDASDEEILQHWEKCLLK
ncbi:sulfatase family protein [Saccharicrinis fermentans]|uniref:Arylsulfatase n=1 Tax=Saccharicrinis fermentans DSM 9555 = JCM 21142 TaxID=869213 RepID=W7Y2G3_9BACT|nr:sulfatase [Saccharicrinis fermentans]GAF05025.1 arylsulfatase [Saccharicrinis fermentans DSM 9555 = JCM 21142]